MHTTALHLPDRTLPFVQLEHYNQSRVLIRIRAEAAHLVDFGFAEAAIECWSLWPDTE